MPIKAEKIMEKNYQEKITSMSRAKWIGNGDLFHIDCVVNKGWTAMQNLQYQDAYKKQKEAIKSAVKNESKKAKEAREAWDGVISPNPENLTSHMIWKLKEVEKKIEFKKGLICGLQMCRESNDSLLELSKSEVLSLEVEQMKILEQIDKRDREILGLRKMCIFKKEEDSISDVSNLGKRCLENSDEGEDKTSVKKTVVPGETIEYWLRGTHMVKAMRILSWDKDEANE